MRSDGSIGDRKHPRDNKNYHHDTPHCMSLLRDILIRTFFFVVEFTKSIFVCQWNNGYIADYR
jgi:hypothetical protein